MKVDILASGSKGNCIALTAGESTILVDAGIAKTKIEKALLNVGITPNKIQSIFITHAHKDHTKGLPLANKFKIPVYAGDDEWKSIKDIDEEIQYKLRPNNDVYIHDYQVKVFSTHHDAFCPVGYSFHFEGFKVSICLDTGKVDHEMLEAMKDSDIYIIESNHSIPMVEASDYPNSVKARILSDVGHLCNTQTAFALSKLIQGKGERIYLTHLSSNNNIPALAKMATKRALKKRGFKENKHYRLEVIE
ncbi:MBL fold metallo-hydrolase [Gracilibacillus sp. D59]|uniref:MBL fold metallo-hydrolase n=1 Tax=Gracilibacillus sp. D59 TaxID=3457434 RepID=UPI003FCC7575